jgi:glycerol uptake facilitator-like aquaporin
MKNINLRTVLRYLYEQLTGNFAGFLIGVSATGLVSHFFETRSIKNLWGLTAKKTIVNKETFHQLEWIISIVFGFIVFEIVTKVIKERLERNFPKIKMAAYRWIIRKDLHAKMRSLIEVTKGKGAVFYAGVHQGVKQSFKNRFKS